MKKITLLLVFFSISLHTFAQLNEDFEGGTFPPMGWTSFIGSNGLGTTENWRGEQFETGNTTAVCVWEALPAGQRSEDWLVTSQFTVTSAASSLFFDSIDSSSIDYGSIFTVRVSTASQTTQTDFTIVDTQDETQISNSQATMAGSTRQIDLSAYIGQSIYVAFVLEQNDGDLWRIDNVRMDSAITCTAPAVVFSDSTPTTFDISLDEVADYTVEYGVFPYTQGSGGTTINLTGVDTYQFTGMTPGTSYSVFVRKNCSSTDQSVFSERTLGTRINPITSFPHTEDFEVDANQALALNLGLWFATNTNNWVFASDNTTDNDTTNDFAFSGTGFFVSNNTFGNGTDADATLYIGPFSLTTDNEYTFSLQQRCLSAASATRPAKDIELVATQTPDGTANTVLSTFDDIDNVAYQNRTGTFTPTANGDYYFGVRDKTDALLGVTLANSVFVEDFSVDVMPLSVSDFDTDSLKHFYNKATSSLIIESSLNVTKVEVYSALGQHVLSKEFNIKSATLNVSELSSSIYIAKVYSGKVSKVIKFIKN